MERRRLPGLVGLGVSENEKPAVQMRMTRRWPVVVGVVLLAGACGYFWFSRPTPDISRARRLVELNDVGPARAELDRILREKPVHSEALLLKGKLLRMEGDLSGAMACFGQIPPESSDCREASLLLIQALMESSNLAEAEMQMQRHLQSFPDERPIWDELRWLCFNQFRSRDVEELSHWWLKTHPDDTQALTHLLLGVFRPQVPQEGTQYLKQLQGNTDQQGPVLRALGWAAWQSGQNDEARKLLALAWDADADDPRTRFLSAEFLIEEQSFAAAARVLGTEPFGVSGEMFGDQTDRWHWLQSRVLLGRNQVAAALDEVTRAATLRNGELNYIHSQAVLLKQLGRDDEARTAFHRARTIEKCRKRFAEIAFSGEWKTPGSELRRELADLYHQCGDWHVAELWRKLSP